MDNTQSIVKKKKKRKNVRVLQALKSVHIQGAKFYSMEQKRTFLSDSSERRAYAPISQLAEEASSNLVKCEFDSH